MRNKLLSCFVSMLLLLLSTAVHSQVKDTVEMADTMRGSGKIYVVIAVILTILAGLILYLVRIDRRLTRLEKENP